MENLERVYKEYLELESFLRSDEEIFDLLISSPVDSIEFILNRDFTIFIKPYSLISLEHLQNLFKKSEFYFSFFYNHLEYVKTNPKIYIPMLRYFVFLGSDQRLFTLFVEFHKDKKMFPLLLLSTYFTSFESNESKNYKTLIENYYSPILYNLLNGNSILYYSFKKKFDLIKHKFYFFEYLKKEYEKFPSQTNEYKKILIINWLLNNLLTVGNFYIAFQFYLWIKKKEDFNLHKELIHSWEIKLAILFVKNQKFYLLRHFKNKDLYYFNQEDFMKKYKFIFPQLEEKTDEEILKLFRELEIDYHFISVYILVHYFYEEILMSGMEFLDRKIKLDLNYFWNTIKEMEQNLTFKQLLFLGINKNDIDLKKLFSKYILVILYKYRKKIISYCGMDPFFRSIIGILYENFKPEISLSIYQNITHPLIFYRMYELINTFDNSEINKNTYKKKIEKFKKYYNLVLPLYGK